MYRQPINAFELKQYWQTVAALKEGESIDGIPMWCMPPWSEICSDLSWETYLVGGGYFAKKHHGYCGVYRLIGLETASDLKTPITFNRVCGQDPTGTLYIGHSRRLNERLNQMRLSRHNAIEMLRRIHLLKFPLEKLAVAMLFTTRHTRLVEGHLIEAYMNSYGDTPPLNYKL